MLKNYGPGHHDKNHYKVMRRILNQLEIIYNFATRLILKQTTL